MNNVTFTDAALLAMTGMSSVWLDPTSLNHGLVMIIGTREADVSKAIAILAKNGVKAIARPNKGNATARDLGGCDVRPYTDAAGREAARMIRSR